MLPNKGFKEKLAAISAVILCLTTVRHSLLLPPTNEFLQLAGQAPGNITTNLSSLSSWDLSMTTALNILEYAMSTLEIS